MRSRRGRILCGILIFLSSATPSVAMYTANPAGRWPSQRFFLAGDFQYVDKDLAPGGKISDGVGFFVRPGFSIAPNVVVYGRLGVQTADNVDAGFAGGFGVQGAYVIPSAPEFAVGAAADFLYWDGGLENGHSIDWLEFQLAPAVSYNIPPVPELTPYAGILFDFVEARGSIGESDPVGMLFGTNFDPTDQLRFNAQFRVISETGFFLSVGYIF